MPRNHKRLLAATGAAAAASAIALAGMADASAASPAVSGTEHFQFMTTSPTASSASIIATGAFTAGGVDHPGRTTDMVVFPTGSFKVAHSKPTGTQTLNPKTCLVTASQTGTYTINGGTGTYTGISGHGTYRQPSSPSPPATPKASAPQHCHPPPGSKSSKRPGRSTCNPRPPPSTNRCGTGQAGAAPTAHSHLTEKPGSRPSPPPEPG